MSEIDTSTILDGLTRLLHMHYPGSHIFSDEVTQGLSKGDFIVVLVNASQTQDSTGKQYRQHVLYDVIYFPKNGKPGAYAVGDRLLILLELLELSGGHKIRGKNMSYKFVDGVLHFSVSYSHNIRILDEQTNMEQLTFDQQGG